MIFFGPKGLDLDNCAHDFGKQMSDLKSSTSK